MQKKVDTKNIYAYCLGLPDIYTFTNGQKDTRAPQDLLMLAYLIGVKVHLSLLNCDIDGVEIILELPDFMISSKVK